MVQSVGTNGRRRGRFGLGAALLLAQFGTPATHAAAAADNFQARRDLNCVGTNCRATFAQVANGRELRIDFVSCFVDSVSTVEVKKAFLGINDASGDNFRHTLIWEIRSAGSKIIALISQPVDITVRQNQRPDIAVPFAGSILPIGECAIAGKLVDVP